MERKEWTELTVLCLLRDDEKLLLQNRVKKDWQGWTLPGGHVEPGESIVDAVIREMREETGLTVISPRLCGVKQFPSGGGRYLVFLFCADSYYGSLTSSREGQMCWFTRQELGQIALVEDFMELLQVMESDSLNEFQYVIRDGQWQVRLN